MPVLAWDRAKLNENRATFWRNWRCSYQPAYEQRTAPLFGAVGTVVEKLAYFYVPLGSLKR